MTAVTVLQTHSTPVYACVADYDHHKTSIKRPPPRPKPVLKMTDAIPAQQDMHRGVKRIRKAHNKVRTGCLTCKIRRKKCDETWPACTRCTSTGRKCDGYATPISQPAANPYEVQDSASPVSPCPPTARSLDYILNGRKNNGVNTDVTSACDLVIIDEKTDETEVSEFILSYASSTQAESSASYSPYSASTPTTLSYPSRSQSPLSDRHRTNTLFLARSPNFFAPSSGITSIEASCFSYFKHVTGPSFASYFESSLWRTYAINAALAHPVVFSAATALGAVHQRFNYGISREAFEYCAHADRLHRKTVKALEELKSQNVNKDMIGTSSPGGHGMGVCDRDVIMVSEMLLGLFEGFQQNYERAVEHSTNGMKLMLARPMTLVHSETRYCAIKSRSNFFSQLFHQLHCRALQLFGSPTKILAKVSDNLSLPTIPDVFTGLDEARDFIFTEVDWIIHTPARAWMNLRERNKAQSMHAERLMKWGVSYAETVKNMERTTVQKNACQLMKLARNAAHLLLFMTLFATADLELLEMPDVDKAIDDDPMQDPELSRASRALRDMIRNKDFLKNNLARVKILSEGILDDQNIFHHPEQSVAFDSAMGPPKSDKKSPDSSNKTRHLIKTFLNEKAKSAEVCEMLSVYGVAERISAVEEHAVISAIRNIIPEHIDPRWVDMTCLMESRKLLLRYCSPDKQGMGMMWTQEWWAF